MAKKQSKAVSFRLKEETGWMLADLAERAGLSQTGVVERLIAEAHGSHGKFEVIDRESGEIVREAVEKYSDPRAIPGISVGMPKKAEERFVGPDFSQVKAEEEGFPCRCIHSGCQGARFKGKSRFQNRCFECEEKGHAGDPRNCVECFNDTGPA